VSALRIELARQSRSRQWATIFSSIFMVGISSCRQIWVIDRAQMPAGPGRAALGAATEKAIKRPFANRSPGYLNCRNPELHTLRRAAVKMAQIVASAA
jgi:hypothetical protein